MSHNDPVHLGEPGIGPDLAPPFTAEDEATSWLFSLNRRGIRPGLGRIQGVLGDLGNPERRLRSLVVAGTNGKGSTTRILAHLLQKSGLKVGCYTSPHLLRVYERLTIDDRAVEPARFAAAVERLRPFIDRHEASWFESLTAAAVQICHDEQVDVFCVEVGLGGRLDATNALPAIATLLTTVALDHQHILGETLEEIHAEKLGLLKRDTPFFCAVDAALRPQAFRAAVEAGSPAFFLDELSRWDETPAGPRLVLRDRAIDGLPRDLSTAQRRNLALALLCLDELARRGGPAGPLDAGAALADLFLPARFHLVLTGPDWLVDTAHNTQALDGALRSFLDRPTSGRRVLIFGGMRDKPVSAELAPLFHQLDAVTMAPVSLPRSRDRQELAELARSLELPMVDEHSIVDSVASALSYWRPRLRPEDAVLVTGSCFLVAEVLHHLGYRDLEETRRPRPAAPALRS